VRNLTKNVRSLPTASGVVVARKHLKYTYPVKGGQYWRFRHPSTVGDVALPGSPGEAAFHARYAELLEIVQKPAKKVDRDTFDWLTREYERSVEFRALADTTQTDYSMTLRLIQAELGTRRFRFTTKAMIKTVRDTYADHPRKAHKVKQMVSRLYSWAEENSLVPDGFNPAKGIKLMRTKDGVREIVVWSDAEIQLLLAECPEHVRTPVLLALYTGQRRQDIVRMTWQQFQGDIIRVRQSKTRALLDIACHSELRRHLEQLKTRAKGVVICTSVEHRAYTPNSLSQALRRVIMQTDDFPKDRSMHGLRYAAGSRMDEAGCTVSEIEAVLGHQTFKMALKYAGQRLRAKAAIAALEARDVG